MENLEYLNFWLEMGDDKDGDKYPEQWMPLSKSSSVTKGQNIYHLTIGKDVVTLSEVEMSVLVYAYKKWSEK